MINQLNQPVHLLCCVSFDSGVRWFNGLCYLRALQERDQGDKIVLEDENIELIKRHEQEKIGALKEEEILQEDELEAVSKTLTRN